MFDGEMFLKRRDSIWTLIHFINEDAGFSEYEYWHHSDDRSVKSPTLIKTPLRFSSEKNDHICIDPREVGQVYLLVLGFEADLVSGLQTCRLRTVCSSSPPEPLLLLKLHKKGRKILWRPTSCRRVHCAFPLLETLTCATDWFCRAEVCPRPPSD